MKANNADAAVLILSLENASMCDDALGLVEENPHLRACWQLMNCRKKRCPAYGRPPIRCWQMVGTFCVDFHAGLEITGKWSDCRTCIVFKTATPNQKWRLNEAISNIYYALSGASRVGNNATQMVKRHWIKIAVDRFGLSSRETEVIAMLLQRFKRPEIAKELGVSQHAAKMHIANLYKKMKVHTRQQMENLVIAIAKSENGNNAG